MAPVHTLEARQAILHYDETTGFNHGTRTVSLAMFNSIATANGYSVTQDSNGNSFTQANLANFDLVVFSNTSGDSGLNASQRAAMEWFVDENCGSLMGIHAATDTYRHSSANGNRTGTWDWYAETLGGSVQQSPNHTSSNHVDDITVINAHPSVVNISFPWNKEEEYYYWENGYINADINEILRVDQTGNNSYDAARPVAWSRTSTGGAKVFYTSLGHKTGNFTGDFPSFESLIEDATVWLMTGCALPVELTTFDANPNYENGSIELNWSTISEVNNNFFEVQYSIDGTKWTALAQEASVGESVTEQNYRFEHDNPIQGLNFYRLRQVDFDGTSSLSEVIELKYTQFRPSHVYPNPAIGELNIGFGSILESGVLRLLDINGRQVRTWDVADSQHVYLNVANLPAGFYLLHVERESGQTPEVIKVLLSK